MCLEAACYVLRIDGTVDIVSFGADCETAIKIVAIEDLSCFSLYSILFYLNVPTLMDFSPNLGLLEQKK